MQPWVPRPCPSPRAELDFTDLPPLQAASDRSACVTPDRGASQEPLPELDVDVGAALERLGLDFGLQFEEVKAQLQLLRGDVERIAARGVFVDGMGQKKPTLSCANSGPLNSGSLDVAPLSRPRPTPEPERVHSQSYLNSGSLTVEPMAAGSEPERLRTLSYLDSVPESSCGSAGIQTNMTATVALALDFIQDSTHAGEAPSRRALKQRMTTKPVLVLRIRSASGLRDADGGIGSGWSDPYCMCQVFEKPATRIQTHVINDDLNPVWNFEAELTGWDVGDSLWFQVFDKDYGSADDSLGYAVLESSSFFPHGFEGVVGLSESGNTGARIKIDVAVEWDDQGYFNEIVAGSKRVWEDLMHNVGRGIQRMSGGATASVARPRKFSEFDLEPELRTGDRLGPVSCCEATFVRHPHSKLQAFSDSLAVLFLLYDAVTIPMIATFEVPMSGFFLYFALTAFIFWFMEFLGNFFKGFYQGEHKTLIEMRFRYIMWKYLKTHFVLDVSLLLLDIVFLAIAFTSAEVERVGEESRSLRGLRFLRVARTARIFAVIRLAKLQDLSEQLKFGLSANLSQMATMVLSMAWSLLVLMFLTHYLTCTWYALGKWPEPSEVTWLDASDLRRTTITYQYLTSFHYILTQFTPASMSVRPVNARERGFTLTVDLFGLVLFSSFVSSITTKMTGLRMLKSQQLQNNVNLKRLFRQNQVSLETCQVVYAYVQREAWLSERMHAKELSLVSKLPVSLQKQLFKEIYTPQLTVHPFFEALRTVNSSFVLNFAAQALEEKAVQRQDKVFARQEVAAHMIIVELGTMRYCRFGKSHTLTEGDWLCEPAIWISGWITRGSLFAESSGEMMLVSAETFREMLSETELDSTVRKVTCHYAFKFVNFGDSHEHCNTSFCDLWLTKSEAKSFSQAVLAGCGLSDPLASEAAQSSRFRHIMPRWAAARS